jgi:hypothetical protein
LGAGVDRLRAGEGAPEMERNSITKEEVERNTDQLLSGPILKAILAAGWQSVTYRQNTELQIEAWHWNPRGTWSNPQKQDGYFTGSAEPAEAIHHSWAYPLPHRGDTQGDGDGWSRLTDGDLKSYWKSNPYLTSAFTGENDALHPQWILIDLRKKTQIDTIRIAWANPYAQDYAVQFWTGELEPFYEGTTRGTWQTFPKGSVVGGKGGTTTLKLIDWKIPVRYIRIWMTKSSNTCDTHGSADKRNCAGYAVNELYAGSLSTDGKFTDVIQHVPSRAQTVTWTSSVDPWHAVADLDVTKGDQIGFDFFFDSGITRGLPTMVPIAMLYGTPEDAAQEIAYLDKRHYPVSRIEMGEEPDGQRMLPEDYGALYIQFATAIHQLVPGAKLGGPSFEGTLGDVEVWPDATGRVSFLGRFLDYLKTHGRLSDFTFFSFEHYPRIASWNDLYLEPERVSHCSGLERRWFASQYSVSHDGRKYGELRQKSRYWKGDLACGLCRLHDDGRRRRYFLFPLHTHARPPRALSLDRSELPGRWIHIAISRYADDCEGVGSAGRRDASTVQSNKRHHRCIRQRAGYGLPA